MQSNMWLHAIILYVRITWREDVYMKMKKNDKIVPVEEIEW